MHYRITSSCVVIVFNLSKCNISSCVFMFLNVSYSMMFHSIAEKVSCYTQVNRKLFISYRLIALISSQGHGLDQICLISDRICTYTKSAHGTIITALHTLDKCFL